MGGFEMTPLAHAIIADSCKPRAKRVFDDQCGLVAAMDDIHCFETSEISGHVAQLAELIRYRGIQSDDRWFLPAPRTWLESKTPCGREGVLLQSMFEPGIFICLFAVQHRGDGLMGSALGASYLSVRHGPFFLPSKEIENLVSTDHAVYLLAVLQLINSPRIIGRRTHLPHAGLQRRMAAKRGVTGKFPLRAWTEIKLEVNTAPIDESGLPAKDAWLSGARAMHWVRAHLRRLGDKTVVVRDHWRGDASLGIKQSRYKLVPPTTSPSPPALARPAAINAAEARGGARG
jgi:hypothetical protein